MSVTNPARGEKEFRRKDFVKKFSSKSTKRVSKVQRERESGGGGREGGERFHSNVHARTHTHTLSLSLSLSLSLIHSEQKFNTVFTNITGNYSVTSH